MSRPRRPEFPGAVYFIQCKGMEGRRLFVDDEDRKMLLSALVEISGRFGWRLHSYVLMDDHYQMALTTTLGHLSRGMRQLNGVYTQYFNRRHQLGGPLFHGRFRSVLIEPDAYLLDICRYVLLEPQRQGVSRSDRYRWSSCRATLGDIRKPGWLDTSWLSAAFGAQGGMPIKRFKRYLESDQGDPAPLDAVSHQVLLGGPAFVATMLPLLDGTRSARGAHVRRKSLRHLFLRVHDKSRNERNALIREAHFEYGYTLAEIGDHLGLHYTTVSKVINSRGAASH